ncbi:hypothetical protein FOG18_13715 (plasmid) [Legionella israelensis]|uniref:SAM-dependent methyltransferase n=1 Tax=Legionella israelensis TaxID=454 RepID=UPI00117D3C54|nr:SAM-dependent methyltransferase [Legionella israelensis]QDP73711.1 hypothetical protein FOG18_13715 [Legionella israelensis]
MNKLFIAGCGIKFLSHMTHEVQAIIQHSDCVVFLVNDPAMKKWILENSKKAISLDSIYFGSKLRKNSYDSICQEIIRVTKLHKSTSFITYGHPLFLSNLSKQLIEKIEEKYPSVLVEILPGISSLDTMLCDLRVDPVNGGLQAYEATDFINSHYQINSDSHLILWQIGIAGIQTIVQDEEELIDNCQKKQALLKIQQKLLSIYQETHPVTLYVASIYPSIPFKKIDIPLFKLDGVNIPRLATAYIPPTWIL